jgi:2-amino-4-hydroxy-6-hydroxymethyldihydropteridine diphosphokinase
VTYVYAIGLGSNRRHGRHGAPARVIEAALFELNPAARSRIHRTAPLGPSTRHFANAAALIHSSLSPPALLAMLKRIERQFGRRHGRRWGARVLDLDILLWSAGRWSSRTLSVPHARLSERRFALDPLVEIVPDWRISGSGTVRQQAARLTRPRPTHRSGRRSGP